MLCYFDPFFVVFLNDFLYGTFFKQTKFEVQTLEISNTHMYLCQDSSTEKREQINWQMEKDTAEGTDP